MAFESVRSYVQLASGLGEMTKARAMEAAQGLLALPGADEVTRRAVQASTLADQLLEAAKANRTNLLSLVQAEVEAALRRADVARLADVEQAKAALATVTKELADLRAMVLASGASAVATAARSGRSRGGAAPGAVSTRPAPAPSAEPTRLHAAPTRDGQGASGSAAVSTSPAAKTSASDQPAAKKTASKTGTRKTPASKPAAAKKTASKTAAAKKTASKTGTSKTGTSKRAATSSTPRKSTSTGTTPTRKATS